MINKVASTFQVDRRVQCMANCSVSLVCDSYNYRDVDKTCQFNTRLSLVCDSYNYYDVDKTCQFNTRLSLVSSTLICHWSVTLTTTVTPTRRASSTLTCPVLVCDSYNYHDADKTCQFNTHDTPLIANSTDIVDDSAWSWSSSTFTVLV